MNISRLYSRGDDKLSFCEILLQMEHRPDQCGQPEPNPNVLSVYHQSKDTKKSK